MKWTQKKLAEVCGVNRQRISDWERGLRPVPAEALQKLTTTLQLGGPVSGIRVKSSRRLSKPTKPGRLIQVQVDEGHTWLTFPDNSIECRYESSDRRPPDYFLRLTRVDSISEIGAWREMTEDGAEPCFLSPADFPRHPLVDGKGWALGTKSKACLSWKQPEFELRVWPQIHLRTETMTFRVDALIKVIFKYRVEWAILEINGPTHDRGRDEWREKQLDLPVLYFTNQEATSMRFTRLLRERVLARFAGGSANPN